VARLLLRPATAARLRGRRVVELGAGCHGSVDIMTRTAHYASLTMAGAGYDVDGLT
jgi:hypothetical protein